MCVCVCVCVCVGGCLSRIFFLQLYSVQKERFDWLKASYLRRVGLKFVSTINFPPSVMTSGIQGMPKWSAGNLATVIKVCLLHCSF